MEYRKPGNTDIRISAVTFGAWAIGGWMWGGTDRKAALAAIGTALDEGITSFDTAPVYGFGLSEELVGEALQGKRDQVQILTKYGLRWDVDQGQLQMESTDNEGRPISIYRYATKDSVIKECEDSLRRLGTDYIDLLQIHWPDPNTPIEESMEAVEELIRAGKVKAAGVCNYDAQQMITAHERLPLATNQVPYSMVLRDIEAEVVPAALERQIGILAYSPLQRGLLTGKMSPGQQFAEGDHRAGNRFFRPENIRRVNAFLAEIKPIADAHQASLAQLVLRWTIEQPGITAALAGARNPAQVRDNAAAARLNLSAGEMASINEALGKLKLIS